MTATQVLKKYFGYDSFRGGQEDSINAMLQGQDVLAIMPTGAGKSICFQVPAMIKSGITLVVSPLISLMKDQVGALIQAGIPAAYLNSSLTPRQMELALYYAQIGKYKLIYVAPERLLSPDFLAFASNAQIDMVTVDEAHCISQWGQDFRPGYLQIPQFLASLAQRPVVSAFTATATLQVKEDIVRLLALQTPQVLVTGFARENLYLEIEAPKHKMQALSGFLAENVGKAGIVYCATRKNVELVCETLNAQGVRASRYHAGLPDAERHANQDDFLFDRVQVMVATNAFGMGIDKSNVSFVVHFNMPKDIESYYQEAGRAGRDGAPAKCLLLYSAQDVRTNQWMIENGKDAAAAEADPEQMHALKERDYNRLKQMTFYATTNECLRGFILRYFGENAPAYCGDCGNCNTKFETVDITQDAQQILSCVHSLGGRFGMTMVINVLRGSKNERVEQLGFQTLPIYGNSEKSAHTLRSIIDHLLVLGYLEKTDEQYAVLKLTQSSDEVLRGDFPLEMKLAKEKEVTDSTAKSKGVKAAVPQERAAVYAQLKQLRANIASAQGVPAFVIFTDRSLVDMCLRLPQTSAQFLQVSGVGEAKLTRYGAQFLEVLHAFSQEPPLEMPPQSSATNGAASGEHSALAADEAAEAPSHKKEKKAASPLTRAVAKRIETSETAVPISIIAKRIKTVLQEESCAPISAVKISTWLVEQGFLRVEQKDDGNHRTPTEKGAEAGILQQEQTSNRGTFFVNQYTQAFQQFIVEQLAEIAQE